MHEQPPISIIYCALHSRRGLPPVASGLAGVIFALAATLALAAEPPRKVLVVYSDNRLLPGLAVIDEALDSVLRTEYGPEIELLNEFFDLDRPGPAAYEDDLVAFLRKKYAGTKIDAIVAVRGPALKFLLQRRDQLFPAFRSCTYRSARKSSPAWRCRAT